jgi:hypothetical protein
LVDAKRLLQQYRHFSDVSGQACCEDGSGFNSGSPWWEARPEIEPAQPADL